MKTTNKHNHRVNWIDGMKINKNHFIAMEHATLALIQKAEQKNISPVNYGLLAPFSEADTSLDLMLSVDGQGTINVVLNACHAVTLGGYQIDITPNTSDLLEQSGFILEKQYKINKEESEWYVILGVNPYQSVAVGHSDVDEEPPRRPHVCPQYMLDILPKSETTAQELGANHMTLGKIIMVDGKATVDADFIPPSRSVQSHPDLQFTYNELGSFLNQMEACALHIIQKIYQKKQSNDLAGIALYLSEQVMRYLNENITEFRMVDKHEPPIAMISKLVNLGRVIKTSLDVFVGTGKENFLNYLTNWCDLNQGAFENILVETIELNYVHSDINATLVKVSSFTKLMLSLFKKLSELEYIGKKAESGIFVKEEAVDLNEQKIRRSFLLD